MSALRKAVVLIYLAFLGFSWLQLIWFFGYPSVGGFVLTPSAHPYIPPFSVVITKPSNECNGWAVKLVPVKWLGLDKLYICRLYIISLRWGLPLMSTLTITCFHTTCGRI
jgi:hypothetical protein